MYHSIHGLILRHRIRGILVGEIIIYFNCIPEPLSLPYRWNRCLVSRANVNRGGLGVNSTISIVTSLATRREIIRLDDSLRIAVRSRTN